LAREVLRSLQRPATAQDKGRRGPLSPAAAAGSPLGRARTLSLFEDACTQFTSPLEQLHFSYGTVDFCIEWSWVIAWLQGTKRSSPAQILDVLWPRLLDRLPKQYATDAWSLLGCWDMPTSDGADQYLFFDSRWGAPFEFYSYAIGMIRAFPGRVSDRWSGTAACANYGLFVEDALSGAPVTNFDGDSCIAMTINLKAANDGRDTHRTQGVQQSRCPEYQGDWTKCGQRWSVDCEGLPWDGWQLHFLRLNDTLLKQRLWALSPESSLNDDGGVRNRPRTGCGSRAKAKGFGLWFQAADLAWQGRRLDYVMFFAAMAWDYGWDKLSLLHIRAADRLAKYALRCVAQWSWLLLHELGHNYLGDGHCEHGCCFEIAGSNWLCHVRGRLGLPLLHDYPRFAPEDADDFSVEGCSTDSCSSLAECFDLKPGDPGYCGGNGSTVAEYTYRCRVPEIGIPAGEGDTTFCSGELRPTGDEATQSYRTDCSPGPSSYFPLESCDDECSDLSTVAYEACVASCEERRFRERLEELEEHLEDTDWTEPGDHEGIPSELPS